jgi:hypothetical protein
MTDQEIIREVGISVFGSVVAATFAKTIAAPIERINLLLWVENEPDNIRSVRASFTKLHCNDLFFTFSS